LPQLKHTTQTEKRMAKNKTHTKKTTKKRKTDRSLPQFRYCTVYVGFFFGCRATSVILHGHHDAPDFFTHTAWLTSNTQFESVRCTRVRERAGGPLCHCEKKKKCEN
jgi:hypothetical protein